jgi:hypothetical protein
MANVVSMIGWAIGVSLPGCLIYVVVQSIRKKPMTYKGFCWVAGISCAVVFPRMLERKLDKSNAIAFKIALFVGLKSGCEKSSVVPEKCTRVSSCTMNTLEARYPTDPTWREFQLRFSEDEARAKAEIDETVAVCGSKQ